MGLKIKPSPTRHLPERIDLNDPNLKPQRILTPKGMFDIQPGKVHFMGFDGSQRWLDAQGNEQVHLPRMARVIIADLSMVMGHRINRVHQTTSHVINFAGGGVLSVLYDDQDHIGELTALSLATHTTHDPAVLTVLHSVPSQHVSEVWVRR